MLVEFLHVLAGRAEVFARVKFTRFFGKHAAYGSRHGQAGVRVDVDFANSALGSLAQLLFGNAYGIGQFAAELVDGVNLFLRYG